MSEQSQQSRSVSGVASDLVAGLKANPVMLALVVLNCVGIGGALWFLNGQAGRNAQIVQQILKACLPTATP